MRILYIILGGPSSRSDVAALFGRYLPRFDIGSDLVAQAPDESTDAISEWGGGRALLSRRTGKRSHDQLRAFIHDVQVLWRARPGEYDAIQVRDKVLAAIFAIWVARARRLPVFYWMSFPIGEGYVAFAEERGLSLGLVRWLFLILKGHLGKILLYRHILPRCTHVFVQSDQMLVDVAAQGIPRDQMTAVPMGVDFERTFPSRAEAHRDERLQGRRVIAYLGSLERFRRLDFLLEVMQQLVSTVPEAVLLMIGDSMEPEDRKRLELRASSLGISDRVIWTGWVSPTDAWRWLVNADVAVSFIPRGALYDGASPTKVVEYLALGIPVVVNDQPDQKRLVVESGGGVCCKMEHTAAISAITQILTNSGLAERMHTAGPRYVAAERGYDRIATRVAEVYRRYVPPPT